MINRRSLLATIASALGGGAIGYGGGRSSRAAGASVSQAPTPAASADPRPVPPTFDVRAFKEGMGEGNAAVDTEGFRLGVAHVEENGFGDLFFRGHFRMGETLVVPRSIGLLGAGIADSSLRWEGAAAEPVVQAGANTEQFNSNVQIRNFAIRNLDGTATWALRTVKTAFGCRFAWLNIGVTPFVEGGIDVASGSIVNYFDHLRIESQPYGIRLGPSCNGCWIRGGHIYGNMVGLYAPNELSGLGVADVNFEDNRRHAIYAVNIRGLELSALRLEENYYDASDPASAQVYLERCSGIWHGGYVTGDMTNVQIRPNYAIRFVNSRRFVITGMSERWHATASITADAPSRGRVTVVPGNLETPVDGQAVMVSGKAYYTKVSRSSAVQVRSGTETPIPMEREEGDTQRAWDPATSRSRIAARFPGVYRVEGRGEWRPGSGSRRRLVLHHYDPAGRSQGAAAIEEERPGNSSAPVRMRIEQTLPLAAGDSVELLAYQDSGGDLALSRAELRMERVGD